MEIYTSRHRALLAILAGVFTLVLAIIILQLSREPDHLEWWLGATISAAYAAACVRIVATGSSWRWFDRSGGAGAALRLAGSGLLILAGVALVWYSRRHR